MAGLLTSAYAILPIEKLDSFKGAQAYLVQTKTLPMVDIEISIDAGDRYDPAVRSGLATVAGQLMNYGAKSDKGLLTEAQIADEIAGLGANLRVSVSGERAVMRIRTLSRMDLRDRAVQLASAMLRRSYLWCQNLGAWKAKNDDCITRIRNKARVSAGSPF